MKPVKIWLLMGPPGSGKGTQAQALAQRGLVWHVSTGDILRRVVQSGSALGTKVQSIIQSGQLVDDATMGQVLEEYLRLYRPENSHVILLDGYPRTLPQWGDLQKISTRLGFQVAGILWFDCPDETLIERLSGRLVCQRCQTVYHAQNNPPRVAGVCDRCGGQVASRADDQPEVVIKRLQVYRQQTLPLKEKLAQVGTFYVLDCRQQPEVVTEQVSQMLGLV